MEPKNHNQPWTSADKTELRVEARGNTPTRVIALHLQRTEESVRAEASKLGISLKPTNQSPYGTRK